MPTGEKTKQLWKDPAYRKMISDGHKGQGLKHGGARRGSKKPLYEIWESMGARCSNKSSASYKHYGARGIKVEWQSYAEFQADMEASYNAHVAKHGRGHATSIERKNVDGNYSKENCIWATWTEQMNNRRVRQLSPQCQKGHAFTIENTYVYPNSNGRLRRCIACQEAYDKKRYANRKNAQHRS